MNRQVGMRIVRRPSSPVQDLSLAVRHFLRRRAIDLFGIALIVFSIITAIALVTWSVADPSLTHATDGHIANWLGAPGAILSDMAMQLLGLGSVAWLLPVAVWGIAMVSHRPMPGMKWRIPLWLLGAAAASGVASAMPAPGGWPLPTGLGGVIGDAMLSAAQTVFSFLGAAASVVAGLALAAGAILGLSAACGYGFDIEQADDRDADEVAWRTPPGKETDSDEPGIGIVSLGAAVHGFMMLKAAVQRSRQRRQRTAPAVAARQTTTDAQRIEPTVFTVDQEHPTANDAYYDHAPPETGPQASRVRMPASWQAHPTDEPARLGAIEPPWRRDEAPSAVHEAFAPPRRRIEAQHGGHHDDRMGHVRPGVETALASPACAVEPTLQQVERPRQAEHMPANYAAPASPVHLSGADLPATAQASGVAPAEIMSAETASVQKVEPTAAAIAAAAELSSRFAARVRKKKAAAAAAASGDVELAEEEETTGTFTDPEPAPQPFVLRRKPRDDNSGDLQAPATDATAGPCGQPLITELQRNVAPPPHDVVTATPPDFRPHTLRVGPPGTLKNVVPANDHAGGSQICANGETAAAARTGPPLASNRPQARSGEEPRDNSFYELPELALLAEPRHPGASARLSVEALEQNATLLEGVLEDFGVRGEIINVRPGPVVTLYELEPAPGTKSSKIISLADDIARSMSAISARVAVVPGRNAIGIELPNANRETVFLRELLASDDFINSKSRLGLCLGKTIDGEPIIADLARMPHLLVAGTTGSGKSVAINTMILSLLYRLRPDECRLIMVDPKMLELSIYDGIPHLLTPVVTDPKKAVVALKWAVREMEDRYKKMSKMGVRNIDGFNARVGEAKRKGEVITRTLQTGFDKQTGEPIFEEEVMDLDPLPYIVVIVDEMADLMMVAGKEIEGTIQRLAQMARPAGIHVVLATQRPSVDVITGTIKANFPTRISFQVTSKIDSRTILGEQGAEQLLGQGDMLYMAGGGRVTRVHGPFVSDNEVEKVVAHLKSQGRPQYLDAVTAMDENEADDGGSVFDQTSMGSSGSGDLFEQAVAIVLRDQKASTSYIQRRLQIGYNRAASLMERMELEGIIGPANHAGKREILAQAPAEDDD